MSQEGQLIEVILQSAGIDGQGLVLARAGVNGPGPQDLQETIEDVVASGSTAQVQSHLAPGQPRVTGPVPEAWLSYMSHHCANLAAVMNICGREAGFACTACMLN